jgi:hypothetical protein
VCCLLIGLAPHEDEHADEYEEMVRMNLFFLVLRRVTVDGEPDLEPDDGAERGGSYRYTRVGALSVEMGAQRGGPTDCARKERSAPSPSTRCWSKRGFALLVTGNLSNQSVGIDSGWHICTGGSVPDGSPEPANHAFLNEPLSSVTASG